MKTISFLNLKGGTGKTVSAANFAYNLAEFHKKRVLLIDGDKQGNSSMYFRVHDRNRAGLVDALTVPRFADFDIESAITPTEHPRLAVITSNMDLYRTDRQLEEIGGIESAQILKNALEQIKDDFDYCVIDHAPAIDNIVINGLMATDDVIIPVRVDDFSFSGMGDLLEQIDFARGGNPSLTVKGCFITHYQNNEVNRQGRDLLKQRDLCPVFETVIHYNKTVSESTFYKLPLHKYNGRSWATIEYKKLVAEYLSM